MRSKRLPSGLICGLIVVSILQARPQFRPANPSGISAAHLTLFYSDGEAHDLFWSTLGGNFGDVGQKPTNRLGIHSRKIMNFPGIVIWGLGRGTSSNPPQLAQLAAPPNLQPYAAPTPTVVNWSNFSSFKPNNPNIAHIGFRAKSVAVVQSNLKIIGVMPLAGSTAPIGYFMSPNGIRVRVVEDPSLAVPIRIDEIALSVPNVVQAARWYQQVLGARISMQIGNLVAEIPGLNIRFVESLNATARAGDPMKDERLGFDTSNLPALLKRLASEGVTVSVPYYRVDAQFRPFKAFGRVQDPFGTVIELTEDFQAAVYDQ